VRAGGLNKLSGVWQVADNLFTYQRYLCVRTEKREPAWHRTMVIAYIAIVMVGFWAPFVSRSEGVVQWLPMVRARRPCISQSIAARSRTNPKPERPGATRRLWG
jgi:hypothetical protein